MPACCRGSCHEPPHASLQPPPRPRAPQPGLLPLASAVGLGGLGGSGATQVGPIREAAEGREETPINNR